jgi:hypothetical protein
LILWTKIDSCFFWCHDFISERGNIKLEGERKDPQIYAIWMKLRTHVATVVLYSSIFLAYVLKNEEFRNEVEHTILRPTRRKL